MTDDQICAGCHRRRGFVFSDGVWHCSDCWPHCWMTIPYRVTQEVAYVNSQGQTIGDVLDLTRHTFSRLPVFE